MGLEAPIELEACDMETGERNCGDADGIGLPFDRISDNKVSSSLPLPDAWLAGSPQLNSGRLDSGRTL